MGIRSARLDLRFDRMKLSCTGGVTGTTYRGTVTIGT
jgi:hypothetical protein